MRKESLQVITREIEKVIEKNLRIELLKEREAQLRKELALVQKRLAGLSVAPAVRRKVPEGKPRLKPGSASSMIVEVMKRTRRPMTVKELTRILLRKGYKSRREQPSKTVDAALRHNPKIFKRVAPNTFTLIR
ncbi:MAG: HTH domain-containing protein [candidate division WOR-3 bacterium]